MRQISLRIDVSRPLSPLVMLLRHLISGDNQTARLIATAIHSFTEIVLSAVSVHFTPDLMNMPEDFDDQSEQRMPSLWQENHGNLLLTFVAAIFIVGAVILTYQQTRFRKPRFPDSRSIQAPNPNDLVSSVANPSEESLTISIVGTANSDGVIMVAIYDTQSNFKEPAKASLKMAIPIENGGGVWSVPLRQLPPSFAVAAYHDANLDGELNRNPFGIPTERYGFSRNARGKIGPPAFDAAVMERPEQRTTIEITLR